MIKSKPLIEYHRMGIGGFVLDALIDAINDHPDGLARVFLYRVALCGSDAS
jgi:hypothetical protein